MLGNVALLFLMLALVFDLVGLAAFSGKLHQRCGWQSESSKKWHLYEPTAERFCSRGTLGFFCPQNVTVDDPLTGNPMPVVCSNQFPSPGEGLWGFDNIFQGFLTIFVMITQDGWTDLMYWYRDTNGEWSQIYFILLEISCATILLNLLIAVLVVGQAGFD